MTSSADDSDAWSKLGNKNLTLNETAQLIASTLRPYPETLKQGKSGPITTQCFQSELPMYVNSNTNVQCLGQREQHLDKDLFFFEKEVAPFMTLPSLPQEPDNSERGLINEKNNIRAQENEMQEENQDDLISFDEVDNILDSMLKGNKVKREFKETSMSTEERGKKHGHSKKKKISKVVSISFDDNELTTTMEEETSNQPQDSNEELNQIEENSSSSETISLEPSLTANSTLSKDSEGPQIDSEAPSISDPLPTQLLHPASLLNPLFPLTPSPSPSFLELKGSPSPSCVHSPIERCASRESSSPICICSFHRQLISQVVLAIQRCFLLTECNETHLPDENDPSCVALKEHLSACEDAKQTHKDEESRGNEKEEEEENSKQTAKQSNGAWVALFKQFCVHIMNTEANQVSAEFRDLMYEIVRVLEEQKKVNFSVFVVGDILLTTLFEVLSDAISSETQKDVYEILMILTISAAWLFERIATNFIELYESSVISDLTVDISLPRCNTSEVEISNCERDSPKKVAQLLIRWMERIQKLIESAPSRKSLAFDCRNFKVVLLRMWSCLLSLSSLIQMESSKTNTKLKEVEVEESAFKESLQQIVDLSFLKRLYKIIK